MNNKHHPRQNPNARVFRQKISDGDSVWKESKRSFATQAMIASALPMVLTLSILAIDRATAFVHRDAYRRQCNAVAVSTIKIQDISAVNLSPSASYLTSLFSGDDDDGDDMDMDMGEDDDFIDEDYDDNDLVIDVNSDYDDYDDGEDDIEIEDDPYVGLASSEFDEDYQEASSALTTTNTEEGLTTDLDWGGALGSLRSRMDDVESGSSGDPSQALFRLMSAPSPNQIISNFVTSANPQVVQAMSGAVSSLLGGLSNPNMGVEVQVKASGEKIGSLCFQLQMTGYMFRNAEYVLALKDLMQLRGKKLTLKDYKKAFDRVDTDNSGYIELSEIQNLFKEAYGGNEEDVPAYEIRTFLEFFDTNEDGKISWEEFEQGLASAATRNEKSSLSASDELAEQMMASMESAGANMDDDEDEEPSNISESISGTIEIEMESGKVVEVDAKEYMESLKEEARKLKLALRQEKPGSQGTPDPNDPMAGLMPNNPGTNDEVLDIASYIASRQGDVKSLTEGIKPEIVNTMKKLVEFVLDGGDAGRGRKDLSDEEKASLEMEIPGSALQQLALWQLVLGYKLREEEAKGDYVKLLK